MRTALIGVAGAVLLLAAWGCDSKPPSGDAPNTEAGVKADEISPELKQRQSEREKVFGKAGPPTGGPGPGP